MKLALLLCAVSVGVPVCSANLITNGDFETNAVADFARLDTNDITSLPGWKVIGSACTATSGKCTLVLNTIYTEPNAIGTIFFQSQSGNQSIDITGGGNTTDGGVEQTLATNIGTAYALTFYLGNMDNNASLYGAASSVRVKVTGQADQFFSNNVSDANHLNWALQTYTFTATSALTTIDFINNTSATDNEAGIDNVQLNVASNTPEPSTWGLMVLGGLALTVRRAKGRSQPHRP